MIDNIKNAEQVQGAFVSWGKYGRRISGRGRRVRVPGRTDHGRVADCRVSVMTRIPLMLSLIRHCDVSGCCVRVGVRARATASASFTSRMVETDSVPR